MELSVPGGYPSLVDKAERRQQLLGHARDVFAKHGFHTSTVDDIVQSAGVARGTFYLYFEDKRAVFEELVDRFLAKLAMAILRVDPADTGRSVESQIRENLSRVLDVTLEDRSMAKLLLTGAQGIDPAFDRKLGSFYGELLKLIEESLKEGRTLGIIVDGAPASLLAVMGLGAFREVLIQIVDRGLNAEQEDVVNALFVFLKHGLIRTDAGMA